MAGFYYRGHVIWGPRRLSRLTFGDNYRYTYTCASFINQCKLVLKYKDELNEKILPGPDLRAQLARLFTKSCHANITSAVEVMQSESDRVIRVHGSANLEVAVKCLEELKKEEKEILDGMILVSFECSKGKFSASYSSDKWF